MRYTYGASVEDALEKLQYDLFYIKNLSLALDLFIIFDDHQDRRPAAGCAVTWRRPCTGRPVVNAMTIDVEDYFHVSVFDGVVPRSAWDTLESRVCRNTERLLDIFDEYERRTRRSSSSGWVAERFPDLVRRIADRGPRGRLARLRAIASSTTRRRAAFRDDVRRAKALLEDAGGRPVRGYRAPSYSITPRSLWALDVLIEEGYRTTRASFRSATIATAFRCRRGIRTSSNATARHARRSARLDDARWVR